MGDWKKRKGIGIHPPEVPSNFSEVVNCAYELVRPHKMRPIVTEVRPVGRGGALGAYAPPYK